MWSELISFISSPMVLHPFSFVFLIAGKIDLRFLLIGLKISSRSVKGQFHENTQISQPQPILKLENSFAGIHLGDTMKHSDSFGMLKHGLTRPSKIGFLAMILYLFVTTATILFMKSGLLKLPFAMYNLCLNIYNQQFCFNIFSQMSPILSGEPLSLLSVNGVVWQRVLYHNTSVPTTLRFNTPVIITLGFH